MIIMILQSLELNNGSSFNSNHPVILVISLLVCKAGLICMTPAFNHGRIME